MVVFLIAKSGNDNFVAYRYKETAFSCTVEPEWVMSSPTGIRIEALSMTENFLMGVTTTTRPSGTISITFSPEQIRRREMELILDSDGMPAILGMINGLSCRLLYSYVQMQKSILPDVEYINLYGIGVDDGKLHVERLNNSGSHYFGK
jgi:hypothetical protein